MEQRRGRQGKLGSRSANQSCLQRCARPLWMGERPFSYRAPPTDTPGLLPPLLQLRTVQQWRWALLHALHEDGASSRPDALAQHYEALLFRWMRLRKAVARLLSAVSGRDGAWTNAVQRWAAAAEQLDTAAGMAAGAPPPKPLLWKAGGRPLLPRALELSEAYSQLLALCEATRCAQFRPAGAVFAGLEGRTCSAGRRVGLCSDTSHRSH